MKSVKLLITTPELSLQDEFIGLYYLSQLNKSNDFQMMT